MIVDEANEVSVTDTEFIGRFYKIVGDCLSSECDGTDEVDSTYTVLINNQFSEMFADAITARMKVLTDGVDNMAEYRKSYDRLKAFVGKVTVIHDEMKSLLGE